MTIQIDVRHLLLAAVCVMFGFGLRAFAAPAEAAGGAYDVKCLSAAGAGVKVTWASEIDKPQGWGAVIKQEAAQGWTPIQFLIAPMQIQQIRAIAEVHAVCFRRGGQGDAIATIPAAAPVPDPRSPAATRRSRPTCARPV